MSLPPLFFRQICRLTFAWHCKQPILAYSILRRQKQGRGLGLPDINLYYKAMTLVCILNWHNNSKDQIWVTLEKTIDCHNLIGAAWVLAEARGLSSWMSLFVLATLKIWDQLTSKREILQLISLMVY